MPSLLSSRWQRDSYLLTEQVVCMATNTESSGQNRMGITLGAGIRVTLGTALNNLALGIAMG